ncbi:MAG: hypothetical protein EBR02_04030 [Alphaproteobacteria bacterium]|nr:hypothetical protein [Alphaproteobacteria bacterium]
MLAEIIAKSFKNLLLPSIWKIFLLCILIYMISGIALALGISALVSSYIGASGAESAWLTALGSIGGWMIAWFMFPLLYPILISFFDEKMAEVIEREDYPLLPTAEPPFWPTLGNDALFTLKAIGLNILCLPLYFIPLFGQLLYYGLNGYLLGKQFFRMAAGRRANAAQVKDMQKQARGLIFMCGVGIMICATIPLLNFVAPLLGVATMLHLFHSLHGTKKQELLD